MNPDLRNTALVARREYGWRVRSRTFVLSTLALVALAVAGAAAPILIQLFVPDRSARVALYIQGSPAPFELGASLSAVANPDPNHPRVVFVATGDLPAARQEVVDGKLAGVLAVAAGATPGALSVTYYGTGSPFDQTQQRVAVAVNGVAFQVRLLSAGLTPAQIQAAAAPPDLKVELADPTKAAGVEPSAAAFGLGFGMTVIIFIAILVYGQWIAMSVAEEKSSRVMEVVLNAATPLQLLSGKVVGVGAVGLTQYVLVAVPAILVLVLRGPLEELLLGAPAGASGTDLTAGLTLPLVLAFGAFFLLGFALYAMLFAGVASLVSRQEDLNPLIGPITMVATLGYLLGAWSMSGIITLPPAVLEILSYTPFLSPYLMLARYAAGQVGEPQVLLALVILAASVLVTLWFAARLYSAGVLLYGQRPSFRKLIGILRTGG